MIIIAILGLIVVIAIIYFITAGEKLNKENPIGNYQFESVDVASKMIEDHKANVLTFLEEMCVWENTMVLHKWSNLADFIRNNPFSIKFNQGACPKCSSSLIMVEYSNVNSEIFICKECKTQFDKNRTELINDYPMMENPKQDLINVHIAKGEKLSVDLKNTLSKLYPRLCHLLKALNELNCSIAISDSTYMEFVYKDKSFIVWLNEENILHYPNWRCIEKKDFTQDVISKIQALNHDALSCIYWLLDEYTSVDQCYYLSSNIDIYKYANKPIESTTLKDCLDRLITEADLLTNSNEHVLMNADDKLEEIEKLLQINDCQEIYRDEDGDINFKFKECNMYIKILDSNHVRVFWHCQEFNYKTNNENIADEEGPDMIALLIQWSNLVYPYKYTYYKPTNTKYSLTAHLDFDYNFIKNTIPEYIKNELTEFVNFIYNTDITDEDYVLPIQDCYLPVIYAVKNSTDRLENS